MRLLPASRAELPTSVPLSILDATVARFAPTGAIFVFDSFSREGHTDEAVFLNRLQSSFVTTLDLIPQWAGQLQWAAVRPSGCHTERFNRPIIVYGTESDPGVEWTVVRHDMSASQLILSPEKPGSSSRVWLADDFPQNKLVSNTPLALHNLRDYLGLPAMLVRINLFPEGGYAVGVKLAHVLADAQALLVFMHHWSAASRALAGNPKPAPLPLPIFNPGELDSRAAGDIDALTADPEILKTALALPMHRFDWWETSAPGYSPFMVTNTENSRPTDPDLLREAMQTTAYSGPWHTWDVTRPVSNVVLHFSPSELGALRTAARSAPGARQDISRLDALLAHIWKAINKARGMEASDGKVFLNVTLGVRTRVSPEMPASFLGSPLFLTHIGASASEACAASVGETASRLRETMGLFTPEAVAAMLHGMAYEVAPQRLWQGFLGSRHVLVTSWLRLRVYEVDFEGLGKGARYVHALMPKIDGCLQVMETADIAEAGGIDVCLYLDSEAMERLLKDGEFRTAAR